MKNRLAPDPGRLPKQQPERPVGHDSPEVAALPVPALLREMIRRKMQGVLGDGESSPPPLLGQAPSAGGPPLTFAMGQVVGTFGYQPRGWGTSRESANEAAVDRPWLNSRVDIDRSLRAVEPDLQLVWEAGPPIDAYYQCEAYLRQFALTGRLKAPGGTEDARVRGHLKDDIASIIALSCTARMKGAMIFRLLHRYRDGRYTPGTGPDVVIEGDIVGEGWNLPERIAQQDGRPAGAPAGAFQPALAEDIRLVRSSSIRPAVALRAEALLLRHASLRPYARSHREDGSAWAHAIARDLAEIDRSLAYKDHNLLAASLVVRLLLRSRDGRYTPGESTGAWTAEDRKCWPSYRGPWSRQRAA